MKRKKILSIPFSEEEFQRFERLSDEAGLKPIHYAKFKLMELVNQQKGGSNTKKVFKK